MTRQTIEQWLMTNHGYTWDRACELVNDHIDEVAMRKSGGWNNEQIAEILVSLGRPIQSTENQF